MQANVSAADEHDLVTSFPGKRYEAPFGKHVRSTGRLRLDHRELVVVSRESASKSSKANDV